MDQRFLQDATGDIFGCLTGMDEQISVASTKGHDPTVNPDGIDILSQGSGQLTDDPGVFQGFFVTGCLEFRIDLNFKTQTIVIRCMKKKGLLSCPPGNAAIIHGAHSYAAFFYRFKA